MNQSVSGKIGLVLLAAGSGRRMNTDKNKVLMTIGGKPLFAHALNAFIESSEISEYVIVCRAEETEAIRKTADGTGVSYTLVNGGKERQNSVYNGLTALKNDCEFVMVHDAARPFVSVQIIRDCAESLRQYGSGVVGVALHDTIKRESGGLIVETLDRNQLISIQTPQCFRVDTLLDAHHTAQADGLLGTDESMLVEHIGQPVRLVKGSHHNRKITTMADLSDQHTTPYIGHGMDVHAFAENRDLIIGGVPIPFEKGLMGHSDADVLTHAIMDALLGASGLPDIGQLFPDSDAQYKGADSIELLKRTTRKILDSGFKIQNVDCTLAIQQPKIAPYIQEMRSILAHAMQLSAERVNVKATTTEHLGFTGRGEGVAAFAVCLLIRA